MSRRKSIELQVKNKRAERDSNRVLAKPTITILNRDSTCRNQRHAIAQPPCQEPRPWQLPGFRRLPRPLSSFGHTPNLTSAHRDREVPTCDLT